MTQSRHIESSQQQDARIPAWETEYWETIMNEAMESGDQERYEMARARAYPDYESNEEVENTTPIG